MIDGSGDGRGETAGADIVQVVALGCGRKRERYPREAITTLGDGKFSGVSTPPDARSRSLTMHGTTYYLQEHSLTRL